MLVKPGQNLQLKTTAPITDHTVKLVHITLGSSAYVWKLATSGAICRDAYCPSITPLDYTPSVITAGKPVTLFYLGSLANSAALTLRWGYSESSPLTDIAMIRRDDGFWSATITPPPMATRIHFLVTDGINVDTNGGGNGSLPVVPAVDTSVTITFKVMANTLPGESVYIVGNRPELGNWSTSPDSARQCTANAGSQWTCSIRFPVGGLTIEYKYQKIGNGMLTWESGGNYTYLLPNANAEVDNGTFR
ncbi:MAG TPA: carbohydrate-binding module family 20 domain-containing protein [Cellvibrio sp.]|nr:carbohydrate-binding module family 20 domain-containing protein [Cellvibrio sp.]